MTYTIKSYQEEFLDAQERVGKEATKNWTSFGQTPADQLKQAYSQPGFDPETRHYCFENGELVGFLTSKVEEDGTASLEFPIVLPGHEDAESLLFEKALDTLRKKGVKVIRSRVSKGWGKTVEMAKKWGYTFAEELAITYSITLDTAHIKDIPGLEDVVTYEHEKDFEQMVDIFVTHFNMTPENARNNFETLEKSGDKVVAHLVIRRNGKVIGRALAIRDDDPTEAYTGTLYVTEDKQKELLLTKVLTVCKEKGIKKLDVPIFGDLFKEKDQLIRSFESLGFTRTGTVSFYEKKI